LPNDEVVQRGILGLNLTSQGDISSLAPRMRILEDIFLVGSGQIGLSHKKDCHIYLVRCGTEHVLIDAGLGLGTEEILANVRYDGLDPRKISTLLVSHSHADHAGGCHALKSEVGCKVFAPEAESQLIENGSEEDLGLDVTKRAGGYPATYVFAHCAVDKVLKDRELVHVGRCEFETIQVPGHSPGTACFLLRRDGQTVLFSSDVVFVGGTIGLGNWKGSSLTQYRQNIRKLEGLRVDALLPGHWIWTIRDGQEHLDKAIENLGLPYMPPNFQHQHPAY